MQPHKNEIQRTIAEDQKLTGGCDVSRNKNGPVNHFVSCRCKPKQVLCLV
jgi:hypothetical protein